MLPFNKCLWFNESIHTDAYCIDSLNTVVFITCVVRLGVLIFFDWSTIYTLTRALLSLQRCMRYTTCFCCDHMVHISWYIGHLALMEFQRTPKKFYERGWAHLQIHNVYHACTIWWLTYHLTVEWNGCRVVTNHRQRYSLFNSFFGLIKWEHQISALLAFCEGKLLMTGGFPSQRASNVESLSKSWWLQ